jgi:hypothetical protein
MQDCFSPQPLYLSIHGFQKSDELRQMKSNVSIKISSGKYQFEEPLFARQANHKLASRGHRFSLPGLGNAVHFYAPISLNQSHKLFSCTFFSS